MQINEFFKLGAVAVMVLAMSACISTESDMDSDMDDSDMDGAEDGGGAGGGATTQGGGGQSQLTPQQMREQQMREDALANTVFYFEFDRSDLSQQAREDLIYHAEYLMENPNVRYRLEGHADERGTREYNLALGERRSQAVERYLQVNGVSASQLEVISFGEESPVDPRSNEEAWAMNRRVEIH